jgi:photosystem II stability/assembly factor-like uncharacterized protein
MRGAGFSAVACSGRELLWVGADAGTIRASRDAGASWGRAIDARLAGVEWLRFASAATGFAVGSAEDAARTSDGGRTWQLLELPPGSTEPSFLDERVAYCGGAALQLSLDSGASWSTADPEYSAESFAPAASPLPPIEQEEEIVIDLDGGVEAEVGGGDGGPPGAEIIPLGPAWLPE